MLTFLSVFALQAAEPAIDFSGVQEPLGGSPTQVLVLGTTHLNQLPEDAFDPADLALVLDRLEAFDPDIIAIEAVGGRACDEIERYPHLYGEVYQRYCPDTGPALEVLKMTRPEASAEAFALSEAWPDTPSASDRRRLALFQLGAGEPWSAALQWAQLEEGERVAADGLTPELVAGLNRRLLSRNENNQIGVVLGARLGLDGLATMDDHTADSVYARAPEALWPAVQGIWQNAPAEAIAFREELPQYLGSPERVLAGYRVLNSARAQELTIRADFGAAAASPVGDGVARQYVAWWQTRGLRMAANVVEAAGNEPGARVLVIVGASHKAYFDAYLDQMHDWELIEVDEILHD